MAGGIQTPDLPSYLAKWFHTYLFTDDKSFKTLVIGRRHRRTKLHSARPIYSKNLSWPLCNYFFLSCVAFLQLFFFLSFLCCRGSSNSKLDSFSALPSLSSLCCPRWNFQPLQIANLALHLLITRLPKNKKEYQQRFVISSISLKLLSCSSTHKKKRKRKRKLVYFHA